MQTRGLRRVLGLATAFLVLGALTTPAYAGPIEGSILLRDTVKFDGKTWMQTIRGVDQGSKDSVTVSFARMRFKKNDDGKYSYRLTEEQSYSFGGLNESTVVIDEDLTGTIDLKNQLAGVFEGDIDLKTVDGKGIKNWCGGNTQTRKVETTTGSEVSLKTNNSVFGKVTNVPDGGVVTANHKPCTTKTERCPSESVGLSTTHISGTNPNEFFNWKAWQPDGARLANLDVMLQTRMQGAEGEGLWMARIFGQMGAGRLDVESPFLGFRANGLPKLGGTEEVTITDDKRRLGLTIDCGNDMRWRHYFKKGSSAGDITIRPTGEDPVSDRDAALTQHSAARDKIVVQPK